jgi:pimeloyl-ACP methyl ester carboxylesterase
MPTMSWTPRTRGGAALGVLALIAAACGSGNPVSTDRAEADVASSTTPAATAPSSDAPAATTPPTAPDGPTDTAAAAPPGTAGEPEPGDQSTIDWRDYDETIQTGMLEVPVDYDDPEGDQFTLFMVRRPANDQENKVGSLLINPGGPGQGGAQYAAGAEFIFGEDILDRFDIIGWDPRGTGQSSPAIDCIDDYDEYFAGTDITPDDDAERQQIVDTAKSFEDQCVTKNADILQHVGTNDSARDIDSIRRALGEDTISYLGFSYGSELGATWATLFPDTVRAAVLDGAVDPTVGLTEGGVQQAAGFEHTLATYLAACSADAECAFHNDGDAEGAFDDLMLSLDEEPIPSESGRPDITRGVALQAVAMAMYDSAFWEQLSDALHDAQQGDGAGLLALWDSYYNRNADGTWSNFLEAFQVIRCMDTTERPTVAEDDATAAEYLDVAPRFAPSTTGSYFCTFFPPSDDPRIDITGSGAGPIVVIGTTGDPATPLASTRVMASTLEDGRLIVVTADKHTGYGENDCVDGTVDRYLLELEIPDAETDC